MSRFSCGLSFEFQQHAHEAAYARGKYEVLNDLITIASSSSSIWRILKTTVLSVSCVPTNEEDETPSRNVKKTGEK